MRVLKLFLLLTFCFSYLSQAQKSKAIARVFYEGDWRYIDKKGNFLFTQPVVNVCFSEKLVVVRKDGKVGFTNFQGKLVIPYQYDNARCFQGNFTSIIINSKMGIINRKGAFVVPPKYDLIGQFDEKGLAGIYHKGKIGFVDTTGKLVIPFRYEWYFSFGVVPRYPFFWNGLVAVVKKDSLGEPKIGFMNRKGRLVIPAKYDKTFMMPLFIDGKATVFENKKAILIDTLGSEIFRTSSMPGYNFGFSFYEGLSNIYGTNDKYGLINEQGQIILKPTYSNIYPFKEGLAAVTFRDTSNAMVYSFINKNGKRAFERTFTYAKYFSEGLVAVESDNKWGYVDKVGKGVIPPKFERANDFYEGLAIVAVKQDNQIKYGFIDKQGRFVIPAKYEEADRFGLGLAPVKLNGKFGYINRQGKMIIPPKFDNAEPFSVENAGK
ncbi:hypothetical protein BKI52_23885 [marine bacterium AO1-C]|nr:hypothetical protein BKI52_23885 [marine bacterium AO1-C]